MRDAREAIARTVEKIAPDYLLHFDIEPYLWESEALSAAGHFQDAIEPPSQFDVVALLLWSRLGTPLPEQTAKRRYVGMDGRAPVTGAEWEFEDALQAAQDGGAPDLLVYRSRKPAQVDAWDAARRRQDLEQLAALDRFWSRHFADNGGFIGAYHEFVDLQSLTRVFESHLRQVVERRVKTLARPDEGPRRATWIKAPFRGLQAFDFDHAPIFFGRAEAVGQALERLIGNAEAGRSFILLLGASGSGKSSLAKAGLAARLSVPRRVIGRSFLRRVDWRPGRRQGAEDVFDSLALALTRPSGGGEDPGALPELGDAQRLAGVLRDAPDHAHAFLETALDAVTRDGRARGALLDHEQAALVLVLDQLEELFTTSEISPDHRSRFACLLRGLARGGRVWIIATLRSDFWHRVAETPELLALAEGHGRFDLLAPGAAEIGQMIRLPAEAAGLSFEVSALDHVPLNERLAEAAAAAPGALPLLSYVLDQLYQHDCLEAGGARLTFATLERLGGLRGAIAARAEEILRQQTGAVQEALKTLLFALVQANPETPGLFTARRAPMSGFKGPARDLVEAFLAPSARLLVADDTGEGEAHVRVAHEALFSEWARARALILEDAVLLSIRRTVEERLQRWTQASKSRRPRRALLADADRGLLSNLELDDARRLLDQRRTELPEALVRFIEQSQAQDLRRRRAFTLGLIGLCAVLAAATLVSGASAYVAWRNAAAAQIQLEDRTLVDLQRDGDDALNLRHDPSEAVHDYARAAALAEDLVKRQPNDPQWRLNLASTHEFLGYGLHKRGDDKGARLEYLRARAAADACALIDAAAPAVRAERQDLQQEIAARLGPSNAP